MNGVIKYFSSPKRVQMLGIVFIFMVLCLTLAFSTHTFLSKQNLVNLLDQTAVVGILACGVTICIISGVFDLSLSAVLVLSAITAVKVSNAHGTVIGFCAAVVVGAILGLINGLIVNYAQINAFIATLATSVVYRGLAIVVTSGEIVRSNASHFDVFTVRTSVGRITWAAWLFVAVTLVTGILLSLTTFGRRIYGVGGNEEASRLSGIRVGLVRTAAFTISGTLAGVAGVIWSSRAMAAEPSMALGMEFTAIIAAIVGGVSIIGGEGSIGRAVLGVFLLAVIGNGFNLLGFDPNYQQVVQGLLILIAVSADHFMRRKRR